MVDTREISEISRSTPDFVKGTFVFVKNFLEVTEEELEIIRSAAADAVNSLGDEFFGLAMLSAIAKIKGRKLDLVFRTEGKPNVVVNIG